LSPKIADPAVATTLIEVAAGVLATEGPRALTLRRLAAEAGTSTMAIYTHFGSMTALHRAIRREGFARLGAHLGAVEASRDPVADLALLGRAYFENGVTNPNLYRAMFVDHGRDDEDAAIGLETFFVLVDGVQRCIDAGRIADHDAVALANHLWALTHGIVTLHLAGFLTLEDAGAALTDAAANLLIGYGDDRKRAYRSIGRAAERAAARGATA